MKIQECSRTTSYTYRMYPRALRIHFSPLISRYQFWRILEANLPCKVGIPESRRARCSRRWIGAGAKVSPACSPLASEAGAQLSTLVRKVSADPVSVVTLILVFV